MVVVEQADGQIIKLTTEGNLRDAEVKCEPVVPQYPDISEAGWLYRLPRPVDKWELRVSGLIYPAETTGKAFTIETRTTWPT